MKKQNRTEQQADVAATYNQVKEFQGQRYTGMKIGRSHKWYYEKGEWKEKKITPDEWQIEYAVKKRRAGKAPEGSGVPVGTEYHWYILADQTVTKLNANDYSTSLIGHKFKVAHKRADNDEWSASENAQRKRVIKLLRDMIAKLEETPTEKDGQAVERDGQAVERDGRAVERDGQAVGRDGRAAMKISEPSRDGKASARRGRKG